MKTIDADIGSLNYAEYSRFLSPYLNGGYKEDTFEFESISIGPMSICSTIQMIEHYTSTETNDFHLAVPIAMCILFQL